MTAGDTPGRILVVEDEKIVSLDIERGLRRLGYEVVGVADNGADAVRLAEAHAPDLVLMDVQLKGPLDGIDTAERIRRTRDVPVVFLTAYADDTTLTRAKQIGPFGYLLKPFDETELHSAIEVALQTHGSVTRERAALGAALERSERELARMLDAVQDYAILLLDRSGHVASWNAGAARTFGYEADDVLGRSFAVFLPDGDTHTAGRALGTAAREGRSEIEGLRRRRDGTLFWANEILTPVHDPAGALEGFSLVTRDTSERKQLVDDLLEAVRVRDEFVSIASHELRTPLAALGLHVEVVERRLRQVDPPVDPRLLAQIKECKAQAERLGRLVHELLDVSRIRLGRLTLTRTPGDLLEIAQGAVARERALGASIPLEVRGAPAAGSWDVERLEQVVQNLVANALKYGAGSPVLVTVDADADGRRACLSVHDDGPGIPAEMQARIFERFERAAASTSSSGLGLGLYICRQIVEAHGGTIGVASQPDRGTTFTVVLPTEETP